MKIKSKDPESAPVCLGCGYNLHGLPRLRCPECGREIETGDELAAARWRAPGNEADRAAHQQETWVNRLGWVLILSGFVLNGVGVMSSHGALPCLHFLFLAVTLTVTILMLRAKYYHQESTGLFVMILGGLLLAGALSFLMVV